MGEVKPPFFLSQSRIIMILFKNDYRRYKNAILDFKTNNESFLKIAYVFKTMGITNWGFCLTLYQRDLQGVNPFDPNLDERTKYKISLELSWNPWYYFREVCRLPEQGSSEPARFLANRANISMIWCFLCHVDYMLIQPRQTGKSASVDSLMVWLMYLTRNRVRANLVTKDAGLRQENIERLKAIRDLFPKWMFVGDKTDSDNQVGLTYKTKDNVYKTAVAQKSEAGANNVGRGMTAPIFQFDETPFIHNIRITMPAALAAGTAARKQAENAGSYYGNIFTTTAGKRDDKDGSYVYNLLCNGTIWNEQFYDSEDLIELRLKIGMNRGGDGPKNAGLLINGTFSHRQLGLTDEWLREAAANSRGTKDSIDRDFLNVWTMGTLASPLSPEANKRIHASERDPHYVEFSPESYMLRWYIPQADIKSMLASVGTVLGLDASEAVGRDAIAIYLIDVRTLKTLMVATINETNTMVFARFLANFMVEHKRVVLIPELKSTARSIIDALLLDLPGRGIDPLRRIYNTIVSEPELNPDIYRELQRPLASRRPEFYNQFRNTFGFKTNAENRSLLYGNILQLAAKRSGHIIYDQILSREIRGLIVKNGRIDHVASGHDDVCVSCYLSIGF